MSSSEPDRETGRPPFTDAADRAAHRRFAVMNRTGRRLAEQIHPSSWIGLESRAFERGFQIARLLLVGGYMGFAALYEDWEEVRVITLVMGAIMVSYTALFHVLLDRGKTRVVALSAMVLDPLVVSGAVLASSAVLEREQWPFAMVGPGTAVPLIPAVAESLLRLRPLPGVLVAIAILGGVGAGTALLSYENPDVSLVVPRLLGMSIIGIALVGVSWSIQQVYRQLRSSIEDKLQLISSVVHELRGPLAALRTYLDLLQDESVEITAEQQREMTRSAARFTTRMEQMITVLSQVERAESYEVPPRPEPVNLHTVAQEVRENLVVVAQERNVTVELADFYGLPLAWAERLSVEQVLSNLVINAIKFSPEGGTVTLRGHKYSGDVGISVEDRGIGIPEEDQQRIFERFYRGSEARRRRIGGTGLGLYVSRSLIERNGGRIWFTSAPGAGSTFGFSLPVVGSRGAAEAERRLRHEEA